MRTKIIEFATQEEYLNIPQPAKKYVPEWYKKAEKFVKGKHKVADQDGPSTTIKLCVPFLDSLISGYMVELWQDVEVYKNDSGLARINWATEPKVASQRSSEQMQGFPKPPEYDDQDFTWSFHFCFKTPPGYSVIFTHPLNRLDLPFYTLTGIVDSDEVISDGNIPFILRNDFEGIIPKGTPIIQIIPFKRDNWEARKNNDLIEMGKKVNWLSNSVISGWYKKERWFKKEYN
jgi:hypothetical protein